MSFIAGRSQRREVASSAERLRAATELLYGGPDTLEFFRTHLRV